MRARERRGIRRLGAIVLALLLGGAWGAAAQTPFVLTGVGQRLDAGDARMAARGHWGMAVTDSLHPGFKNIASLSGLEHVALLFTGQGERVDSTSDTQVRRTFRTYAPEIRVGLPAWKGRLAVTAGYRVDRSLQYTTTRNMTWYTWADTLTGNEQFQREGTLFEVPLGVAFAPVRGLSLGVTLGLARGTVRETFSQFFVEPSGANGVPFYGTNRREQVDELDGTAWTWSLLWSGWDVLQLGASYTPAYDLDLKRKISAYGVAQRGYADLTVEMPDEWRAGLQLRLGERWRLGGDAQYQAYSGFWGLGQPDTKTIDEYTVGFGFERVQAHVRHGGTSNLPLRFGAQIRQWGYEVGGNPIEEKTFTLGTGFPFRENLGQLDVAVSYGKVGSLAKNGMESDVWRLTISVTGLERWW